MVLGDYASSTFNPILFPLGVLLPITFFCFLELETELALSLPSLA
jgi:hypothetical protein